MNKFKHEFFLNSAVQRLLTELNFYKVQTINTSKVMTLIDFEDKQVKALLSSDGLDRIMLKNMVDKALKKNLITDEHINNFIKNTERTPNKDSK